MEIKVFRIKKEEMESVQIRCYERTDRINDIVAFIKSRDEQIEVWKEDKVTYQPITDLCYLEAVDNRIFAYTEHEVYEVKKMTLHDFEETFAKRQFFRSSKSTIVNLMKIKSIKPALNGRFLAVLQNNEDIIISRKYVPALKQELKGGM